MSSTYKDLEIYKQSFELFIKTHKISLQLPKYELYEIGSQLRRSANSVCSNIVEGYGRNKYKNDFIKFLTYSLASNDETINHLKFIKAIYPNFNQGEVKELLHQYNILGRKINSYTQYVIKNWRTKAA